MNCQRLIDRRILSHFKERREILILLGARQVGKTTLIKRLFPEATYLMVDNETVKKGLSRYDISFYKQMYVPSTKTLVIDEIHLLKDPGRAAKIIYDQVPNMNLIVTGSSSLHIKNKMGESLAGRKIDYFLYPLTFGEYLYQSGVSDVLETKIINNIISRNFNEKGGLIDIEASLEKILIYGLYPHMLQKFEDKDFLKNLSGSVIFKDLLDLGTIENRDGALNLLRALAFQIGSLVNINELSVRLGLEAKTIKRYLNIFEQSYIIFPLAPYSKNGRDEIGKMNKYYFWDVGLRNALIDNFNPVRLRNDYGALFENFIISEVMKENYYTESEYKLNFWRTQRGSEIDLVLTKNSELIGIEIKTGKERANLAFANRYKNAEVYTLTPKNFY